MTRATAAYPYLAPLAAIVCTHLCGPSRLINMSLFNVRDDLEHSKTSNIGARAPECTDGPRIRATRRLRPGYEIPFVEHSA